MSPCRNSIGQEFALNEELVVLSHILRKIVFTLDDSCGTVIKNRNLILQLKPQVFLNLHHMRLLHKCIYQHARNINIVFHFYVLLQGRFDS